AADYHIVHVTWVDRIACGQHTQRGRHQFLGMRLHERPNILATLATRCAHRVDDPCFTHSRSSPGAYCPHVTSIGQCPLAETKSTTSRQTGQRFLRYTGLTHTLPIAILRHMLE